MRILKVSLIVFFSIIGVVGAIVLGLYLTGKLNEQIIPPADIFYADVTVDAEGNKTYVAHTGDYFTGSNFELTIGTTTSVGEYTQNKVSLDFGTTVAKKYLKINNESLTPYCYTLDKDGKQVKYVLVEESEGEYITNGKIVVPKTATIGKSFEVRICVAPEEDFEGVIDENAKLYNIGGAVTLYAQSEAKSLSRINATINVDVPVENIKLVPITGNGSDEKKLDTIIESEKEYYVVNLETYFGLKVEFTPARSAYMYGKDGTVGAVQYKKVLFGINNDEDNIALVDANGTVVVGVSDVARMLSLLSGDGQVFARVFKNASDVETSADKAFAEQFELMANTGVEASANIRVTNITIDGFEAKNDFHGAGKEIVFDINNRLIITANNNQLGKSLGINILAEGYSQGAVQKEIENIYLTIQVFKNGAWVDATAGENKYFTFVGSQVYTMNVADSDYYGFNFYQVKFNRNLPNNSFWEIAPLSNNENADYSAIRIQIFYMSSEGIVENNSKYGPYDVDCVVNPVINPEVEWNENSEFKKSDELIADEKNEKILFYQNGTAQPIVIDLTNLAIIKNLNENPSNTLIKYFVCSKNDANLDSKINCKKYIGEIQGLSNEINYIYELLSDERLIISSMGNVSEFEFDIIFAVVQNDFYGNAIKDGESYVIKALPSADNGSLITLPFKISKTVDIGNDTLSIKLNKAISPYGEPNFVLQRTQNCFTLSIKIKTADVEIFKKQVNNGNITLKTLENEEVVDYLYYSHDGVSYSLTYALSTYLETNPTVKTDGEYTIFEVLLSTKEIEFAENEDEKVINILLDYKVNLSNEEITYTAKSTNLNIYSGKILDLKIKYSYQDADGLTVEKFFEGNEVIKIIKRISNTEGVSQISTVYQMEIDGELKDIELLQDNFLKVEFTKYEIDDVLNISSSNSLVLQISYISINDEIKYQLSALKSGENIEVNFKPQFAHSNYTALKLIFNIDANFEVKTDDLQTRKDVANSISNDGILSYDANRGYLIIGAPIKQNGDTFEIVDAETANVNYLFKDLVDIWVTVSGAEPISVKDKLKFTVEMPNDLENYIQFVQVDGEIIGFKSIAKLGKSANLVVYYYSSEIGFNSGVININLAPYYQSQGNVENHENANVSQKEPDAKFVFAEAEINLDNFKVLGFDLATGRYSVQINIAFAAKIASIVDQLTAINSNSTDLLNILKIIASKNDGELIFTPTKIIFEPVTTTQKYILTFAFNDNAPANDYNFSIDYIFYVEPNVKIDETKVDAKIDNDNKIYYLNSQENPFKNGDKIYWVSDGSVGENIYECPFIRIFGDENFNAEKFGYKLYEVGQISNRYIKATSFEISNVKKLTLYELVVNYSGVEFTFRYYAQPNLTLPAGVEKVTYNGKEYVSLYAGQDVAGLVDTIKFGKLIADNKIVSYAELCKLTGVINSDYSIYGGGSLNIIKNKFDIFETYIVLVRGEEYVVYNALIFPQKWAYIVYSAEETDVYKILNGEVVQEITSGNSFAGYFANGIFDKGFKYQIYDITGATILDVNNSFITIDETKAIKTNPMGKDREFKITFTIQYVDVQNKIYEYSFNYFVRAKKSQEITINYPYSEEKNSDDFSVSHKVYYDEFNSNGEYIIKLNSTEFNMLGQNFVKLSTSGIGDFNKLKYEISKVYVNNEEITSGNFAKYVQVDTDSVVTLKNVSFEPFNVVIKVYTSNGAENNYKISVQNKSVNYVIGQETDGKFVENSLTKIIRGNLLAIEGSSDMAFDLSNYLLRIKEGSASYSPVNDLELNFAVLKDGILQTSSNIIYYDKTSKQVIVKSSPNKQTATLYAYTSEGIVAIIEIDMDSPIVVKQTNSNYDGGMNNEKGLFGDQIIDLFDYLSVEYNKASVNKANISGNFALISSSIENYANYVSISGTKLTIKPYIGEKFTITIAVELWGNDLPGTSETDKCIYQLKFTIMPNIEVVNQTAEATANASFEWNAINQLFACKKGSGYTYTLKSSLNNLNDEELALYGAGNIPLSFVGNKLSLTPKAVISNRQIIVTFEISKGDFSTTGTLTITIKPDTTVSVNYPNYGSGQTFNSLYIYNKDYQTNKLLDISTYITLSKTGKSYKLSVTSDYLTINTSGKIELTNDAQSITENKTIIIQILVDGLLRDTFSVTICKDPVFSARYEDNSNNIQESLLADEVSGNPFWFVDGKLSIETVGNRDGREFAIYVIAKDRLTGKETKVLIGATGTKAGGLSKLKFATEKLDGSVEFGAEIAGENIYLLSTIFAGKGVNIDTCQFYFGEFVKNADGVVDTSGLKLTQPTKKITYFYNGFEIPFANANELFKIQGESGNLSDLTLSSTTTGETFEYKVVNKNSGLEIATYSYIVVKDYKLNQDKFANSPQNNSTNATTKDTYKENEFDYGQSFKVSKTIELTAGNSYSLIDLLKNYLGLTSFRNGSYTSKEEIFLTHGKFSTNNNFKYNLGSLISLQELKTNGINTDYTITPNGAQKGGDIVHLVVRFGASGLASSTSYADEDTYIIRIKILPSITINPTSASGEIILSYKEEGETSVTKTALTLLANASEGKTGTYEYYNVALSKLVTISGNYDITKMIVSVGDGAEYVVGTGYANRLGKLPGSDIYGIQLQKTIFGGNVITLTISDRFGYSETIQVQYLNENRVSPTILSQPQSVYEGDGFTLAFFLNVGIDGKKKYKCYGAESGEYNETQLLEFANVIIIDGFNDNKISMDGLNSSLQAKKGKVNSDFTLGYNNNDIFGSSISILPSAFGLKLCLSVENSAIGGTEIVELDVNTSLNQRYKVQAKNPYSRFSTIYIPNGTNYNCSNLFEVYDLKAGAIISSITFKDSSEANEYLTSGKTFNNGDASFEGKTTEAKNTEFKFKLTIDDNTITHTYSFAIAITPKYYEARMEGSNVDSTYGIVVDGASGEGYNKSDWTASIKYYDYYGQEITGEKTGVTFSKKSGVGTLTANTLSDLNANSPVTINVKCGEVNIGEVLVTMRRYYKLTSDSVNVTGVTSTNKLNFNQWAKGVEAAVVGSGSEAIGGGLFTYSISKEGYDIIFEDNQYKLVKKSGNFASSDTIEVKVNYMSNLLGTIKITIES